MTLTEAQEIAGTLSYPSKMPGTSYSLPAAACLVGAKLAKIAGTVCSTCYALRDHYQMPNPRKAQYRRLAALSHPKWIDAMVAMLKFRHSRPYLRVDLGKDGIRRGQRYVIKTDLGYHRWHDSGDIQSVDHLAKICEVARRTPKIKHWLPTNELGIVWSYVDAGGTIPGNLVIRASSVKIDDNHRRRWPLTSAVIATRAPSTDAHECPAPKQNNTCGKCRACWSPKVAHVEYHLH